jgi:hypothetical protein
MTSSNLRTARPITCQLHALSEAERVRSAALRRELTTATREKKELAQGYAFRLPNDGALFERAAEWLVLERRCCPFLSFELSWQADDGASPWLSITGPDGTKEFLAAEIPALID